ncbi:MAG: hypothetical protein WCP21_13700 [Armatimonadota bacterium]
MMARPIPCASASNLTLRSCTKSQACWYIEVVAHLQHPEGKATTIATPPPRFFIRRPASGDLLLVNHYRFTGRSHLSAQLSTADGQPAHHP